MKVLMLNGSPKANGNTALALKEMEAVFAANGIECETVQLGNQNIRGCVACGGCSATFDELNKYFTISNMPIASSRYWNSIHGAAPGEADMDEEGKMVMRTLASNMSFLIKSIALGKEKYGLPAPQPRAVTNFIR